MNPKKPVPASTPATRAISALQAYHFATNANRSQCNVDDAMRLKGRLRIRVLAEVYLRCASECYVVRALGGTDGGLLAHLFAEIQSRCTPEEFAAFKSACEACGYNGGTVDHAAFAGEDST